MTGVETERGALRARLVVGATAGARPWPTWSAPPSTTRRLPAGFSRGRTSRSGRHGRPLAPRRAGRAGVRRMSNGCRPLHGRGLSFTRHKGAFLADRERNFMAGLGRWPELADLLTGASRIGLIRVMSDWHGYFREAAGPGWALLGDAGNFKDPAPAQGISDALRQAETCTMPSRQASAERSASTTSFAAGGDGETGTPTRCTGSPPTWARRRIAPAGDPGHPRASPATSSPPRSSCGCSTTTSGRRSSSGRAAWAGPPLSRSSADRDRFPR